METKCCTTMNHPGILRIWAAGCTKAMAEGLNRVVTALAPGVRTLAPPPIEAWMVMDVRCVMRQRITRNILSGERSTSLSNHVSVPSDDVQTAISVNQ